MIFKNVKKFSSEKSKIFIISGFFISLFFSISGLMLAIFYINTNPLKILSGMTFFALFLYFSIFYYKCLKEKNGLDNK